MTLALISDVHANLAALETVLARIDQLGVERIGCLGDVVGYGAEPVACVRLVMERCGFCIRGNHDWALFHDMRDFNPLARDALLFTRRKLSGGWLGGRRKPLRSFLAQLPERREEEERLFVHGSPRDPVMEYVLKSDGFLEPEKIRENLALTGERLCFLGHTHWPGIHGPDGRFVTADDEHHSFALGGGPHLVNVGSVGQPRDGDPRACFVVVDGRQVEYHRLEYDIQRTQARIQAAGLHPALAERLAKGR